MIREIKLIFDECLSHSMMAALLPFLQRDGRTVQLKAVVDYQKSGVPDKEWIPKIAKEGGWIVTTADWGRQNKKEKRDEKLPYLCRLYGVTHILLTPKVHELQDFEKGQALTAVWRNIVKATKVAPGTRFSLRHNHQRTGFLLVNLDDKSKSHGE